MDKSLINKNIFPVEGLIEREQREEMLGQRGMVVWFTGLSGSGKTTIARRVEKKLHQAGYLTYLLDGDNLRVGLNSDLDFDLTDRAENVRRVAEISKLFVESGVLTLNTFVTPLEKMRQNVTRIIGEKDLIHIYVKCPVEICEQRDTKGLYKKARQGELKDFTGVNAPFEEPRSADMEIFTDKWEINECVDKVFEFILSRNPK